MRHNDPADKDDNTTQAANITSMSMKANNLEIELRNNIEKYERIA